MTARIRTNEKKGVFILVLFLVLMAQSWMSDAQTSQITSQEIKVEHSNNHSAR